MFLAYYKGEGRANQFCGATLIDKRWVMTAAHCVYNEDVRQFVVAYGKTNLANETFEGEYIEKIVIHPSYKPTATMHEGYDVALLKLAKNINVKPIKLNRDDRLEKKGTKLKASGWGLTFRPMAGQKGEAINAEVLQEVQLSTLSPEECYKRLESEMPGYQCAGTQKGDKDTCAGDSGGPVHKSTAKEGCQVGIISYGPKYSCNVKFQEKRATSYLLVSEVLPWVRKYVKKVGTCK